MTVLLSGFALGLALILPIGAQNVFVINQAIAVGIPRVFVAVVAAGVCDTILILAGAFGASTLLETIPGLRPVLLVGGSVFLVFLAVQSFRARESELQDVGSPVSSVGAVATKTATVSLLNPHAILDTVGVLGAAIAAQAAAERPLFALGTVSASWVWFCVLAVAGAAVRHALTPGRRVWVERVSGMILLAFAVFLFSEFLTAVR
ncbi:LysE/ArgO family amino acid transporter [Actinopolyspora mortivallis]|uniref:LysE/ArgO family amino acid transporter n=1 Tax=Actinopolyspora mortivallis TaxID=33906 RepID=UPI0003829667|nr:LysE family transporter [Actinopolyspora mortivallis]